MKLPQTIEKVKEKVLSLVDKDKEKFETRVNQDWILLIGGLVGLTIFFLFIGVYLFFKITTGDIFATQGELLELPQILSREELQEGISVYEEKERLMGELLLNRPNIIDPSL